jgi:hypothetical protein
MVFYVKGITVPHRMFRALVFLLAGWSLLMPPGMCICQGVRAGDVSAQSLECCTDDKEESCKDCDCNQETPNCGPGNQGAPTDEQHPPGCPANKKSDHSRLLEKYQPLTATLIAATPLPFFLDLSSGERPLGSLVPSQASDRPIYLALCTLLI